MASYKKPTALMLDPDTAVNSVKGEEHSPIRDV
jgi:hypothetical protein